MWHPACGVHSTLRLRYFAIATIETRPFLCTPFCPLVQHKGSRHTAAHGRLGPRSARAYGSQFQRSSAPVVSTSTTSCGTNEWLRIRGRKRKIMKTETKKKGGENEAQKKTRQISWRGYSGDKSGRIWQDKKKEVEKKEKVWLGIKIKFVQYENSEQKENSEFSLRETRGSRDRDYEHHSPLKNNVCALRQTDIIVCEERATSIFMIIYVHC